MRDKGKSGNSFIIRKKFHHKNYVFLLSVLPGAAFWSAHQYEGRTDITLKELANLFQKAHDRQIEGLVKESLENEPLEFKDLTNIDDQTKNN